MCLDSIETIDVGIKKIPECDPGIGNILRKKKGGLDSVEIEDINLNPASVLLSGPKDSIGE